MRWSFGVAKDGRPLAKGEVRGDDDGGLLVELADEVEEHLTARACKRQVAKLVEHTRSRRESWAASVPALPRRVSSSSRFTRSTVLK